MRDVNAQVKEDKKSVSGFTNFIRYFLLAFAGIALFVGSFVIANTLSITIAQRTREFATLRTLGATRRQILKSVIVEALVIGILGSVIGLFLGLALAKGLNAIFKVIGFNLPTAGTVFATRTVIVCLVVGTLITLFASLRPARRATRVPPIAAVREGAELPRGRFARWTPWISAATLLIGILLLAYGVLGHNLPTATRLFSLGLGILLLFFGVSANASRVVRPLASVLGWPATRIGGAAGTLARDNAMRNPKRTASTASALMIGLALVTFVAILGQGIRSSFESAVDDLFKADYALTSQDTFTPLTIEAEKAAAKAPGVTVVSGIRAGSAKVFGSVQNLTGADPQLTKVVHLDWKEGSNAVPAELGQTGAFVDDKYAKKHHLHIGSPLTLETPTARVLHLKVDGVFKLPKGGSPFGTVTISNALFDKNYVDPQNEMAFVNIQGGVTDANTAALNKAVAGFADAKIQTHQQFKTNFEKPLNGILSLLYVLLALSVIVSLFGIVNTLVLTVFERTREIGMLRAVGLTRRQTRRMIRHESHRHIAHRRRARNRRRVLPCDPRHARALGRGHRVRRAVAVDRLLRDRGDRRRPPGRDLARAPRREPERPRSAAVRVSATPALATGRARASPGSRPRPSARPCRPGRARAAALRPAPAPRQCASGRPLSRSKTADGCQSSIPS